LAQWRYCQSNGDGLIPTFNSDDCRASKWLCLCHRAADVRGNTVIDANYLLQITKSIPIVPEASTIMASATCVSTPPEIEYPDSD
jgi:hypothetical protein